MSDKKPPTAPNNSTKDTKTPQQPATTDTTTETPTENGGNHNVSKVEEKGNGENTKISGEVMDEKSWENGGETNAEMVGGENGGMDEGVGGDFPPQDRLDHHLAIIEEQFRRGFDERYSVNNSAVHRSLYEDPEETMRTNKIFREVSRCLGGDWRKVYEDLMKSQPKEVVETELAKISRNQPIIQGYTALMSWKEVSGSRNFSLMTLVQSLNDLEMEEIADVVLHIIDNNEVPDKKPAVNRNRVDLSAQKNATTLDNRRMLLISKKVGGCYEVLGRELGVVEEELEEIKKDEGDTYQGCFKVLWAWKETRSGVDNDATDTEVLKSALEKANLKDIAAQIDSIV